MRVQNLLFPENYKEKNIESKNSIKSSFVCILVWIFVICCFLGFSVETIYSLIRKGHYINKQGLVYGPFKPIYGFGGVIFTLIFYKVRNMRSYALFIFGTVVGAAYEYGCSYFQEYFLKSRSWDYSRFKFNLDGRISFLHAFFWGLLTVFYIKLAMPGILFLIRKIPVKLQNILALCMAIFMIFDIFMSLCVVHRQIERIENKPADSRFEQYLDKHYDDEKIKETFTHMKFVYVDTIIE